MSNMKTASLAEFDRLSTMLLDLAKVEYQSSVELPTKLVAMGYDPNAPVQPGYRFSLIPVAEMMSAAPGVPEEVVLATLIEKLANDPEVLVVGFVAEAWRVQYSPAVRKQLGNRLTPETASNRQEVLLLNLRSADCVALKTCPLVREGTTTLIGEGELVFNPRAHSAGIERHTH